MEIPEVNHSQKKLIIVFCIFFVVCLPLYFQSVVSSGSNDKIVYLEDKTDLNKTYEQCSYQLCIDYYRCSIDKPFKFHVYKPLSTSNEIISYYEALTNVPEYSNDQINSCFYIVFISIDVAMETTDRYLLSLPSWKNTGKNHMIFLYGKMDKAFCKRANLLRKWQSILILPKYCNVYNSNYGFPFSNLIPIENYEYFNIIPQIVPIQRDIAVLFDSEFLESSNIDKNRQFYDRIADLKIENNFSINLNCNGNYLMNCVSGWCPCSNNIEKIKKSTFRIIITSEESEYFFNELIESLQYNVIPILVGDHKFLPFSNVIDWTRACILLSPQRIRQLPYILQTLSIEDVVAFKKQGRFLYERYFFSREILLKTILTSVIYNIGMFPSVVEDVKAKIITNFPNRPGISELKYANESQRMLRHNFSYASLNTRQIWNEYPGGLHNYYPMKISCESLPSEMQFSEEGKHLFKPIGDGKGGDGDVFQQSLGGDYPIEEFTVVLLVYDRPDVLMQAIQRLTGVKYLNKVVVLWNHPVDPTPDLKWPDIGVQIVVVRTRRNSLNNRFIPYDVIETEAILSLDDDVYLKHDEIELAFRIWRENRERLVGFPGRQHSYNRETNSFFYNPEDGCELSLVLTGAAFFHKYYSYMYIYEIHSSIRELVDKYMNCEDLALNFLVAHITGKPPIKVSALLQFRCPGCPGGLSDNADHYNERSICMDFLQKVYGYNPLRRTQYRADSILFKADTAKKCFENV